MEHGARRLSQLKREVVIGLAVSIDQIAAAILGKVWRCGYALGDFYHLDQKLKVSAVGKESGVYCWGIICICAFKCNPSAAEGVEDATIEHEAITFTEGLGAEADQRHEKELHIRAVKIVASSHETARFAADSGQETSAMEKKLSQRCNASQWIGQRISD